MNRIKTLHKFSDNYRKTDQTKRLKNCSTVVSNQNSENKLQVQPFDKYLYI